MKSGIPKLGSFFLVLLLLLLFELFIHMWGPGISDYSPEHHLWMTVEGLRNWMKLVGFLCAAFLLLIERKGSGIGRYWIFFPVIRLAYDVGWMVYFGNPYGSWYVQDFGAFMLCIFPALLIDRWAVKPIFAEQQRAGGGSGGDSASVHSRIQIITAVLGFLSALIGLIAALI